MLVNDGNHSCIVRSNYDPLSDEGIGPKRHSNNNWKDFQPCYAVVIIPNGLGPYPVEPLALEITPKANASASIGKKLEIVVKCPILIRDSSSTIEAAKEHLPHMEVARAPTDRRIKCQGRCAYFVESISRLRKALPGAKARHTKVRDPMSD